MQKVKIIYCLFLLCLPIFAIGQLPLSLSDAIQIGLKNNFKVQIANLQSEISKNNKRVGPEGQFPSLNFRMNQTNNFSFDSSPTSFVDGSYSQSDVSAEIDANWTIFDGHQVRINKSRLLQLTERSEAFAQLAIENAIQGIMLAYYKVLVEQKKLDALKDVQQLSLEKASWAATLHASGALSNYNLLNYKNAVLSDSIKLEYQKIKCKRSMSQLKATLGTHTKKEFRLTDQFSIRGKEFTYNKMIGKLVRSNKDLRNQYINLSLRESQSSLMKARKLPKVSIRTGLSQELSTSKFEDEERNNGRVFDYYINFAVSYNLSGQKNLNNQIQVAEIEKRIATIQKEEMKRVLSDQLLLACESYQDNLRILKIQQQLTFNLEKGLAIQKERFDNGYTHFLEFRSLQSEFLQSRLEAFQIMHDLKVAELEILKLTGGLSRN